MRRKKKNYNTIAIVIAVIATVLMLATLTVIGFITYNKYINKSLSGTYYRDMDITESTMNNIKSWLGEDASFEEKAIKLRIILKISDVENEDKSVTHNYEISLDEDSYNQAVASANSILEEGLGNLINVRAEGVGLTVPGSVDDAAKGAMGLTLSEYIEQYGPKVIEDFAVLKEQHDKSGTYDISDNMIIWDAGDKTETFVKEDDLLIFSGTTDRVYRKMGE